MSQTVGVSERTLRNAFADVHRKSPKRYFLNQRLQSVRQALSDAGNKAATVTAVATDYGFYELGRFALRVPDALRGIPVGDAAATSDVIGAVARGLTRLASRRE